MLDWVHPMTTGNSAGDGKISFPLKRQLLKQEQGLESARVLQPRRVRKALQLPSRRRDLQAARRSWDHTGRDAPAPSWGDNAIELLGYGCYTRHCSRKTCSVLLGRLSRR